VKSERHEFRPSRRSLLAMMASSLALLTTTALVTPSIAQDAAASSATFSFDALSQRMQAKAGQPYEPPAEELPDSFKGFDYDSYRKIQYRPDPSKWEGDDSRFHIQAFHLGWLFKESVAVYDITGGKPVPMDFKPADINYHEAEVEQKVAAGPWPGVAGFRINSPINTPDVFDEVVSYLGASYFRALGRGNLYGLSARGIVLNSWVEGPEEFPRFSEFYLERPQPGQPMVFYAALEGPSVTGAYRFALTPAGPDMQETIIEVTARLFFRAAVKELGIAPLTSMFLYADNNRSDFDDYRPQVHDSDGLLLEDGSGQVYWRALNNPPEPANSYFQQERLGAFGLYQRNRDFDDYQDAGAHYEKRPSLRVEPIGDWGPGAVRLIEIPSELEAEDNIGAFFVPSEPVKAGDMREFSYRLRWGNLNPDPAGGLAYVEDTRGGRGGVSGVENADTLRKFVIDFKGGPLTTLDEKTPPDIVAEITGGTLKVSTVSRITDDGIWRLVLDVEVDGTAPVELKAFLTRQGRPVTETWLYQWRAAA
jgi:glucans biosynthesis protein